MPPGMGGIPPTPEQMEAMGFFVVRQHERLELTKCDTGYKGTYTIRNAPPDHDTKQDQKQVATTEEQKAPPSEFEGDTQIVFSIDIKCEHPKPSVFQTENSGVAKIASGIDD